jgi:hypothetical protein
MGQKAAGELASDTKKRIKQQEKLKTKLVGINRSRTNRSTQKKIQHNVIIQ